MAQGTAAEKREAVFKADAGADASGVRVILMSSRRSGGKHPVVVAASLALLLSGCTLELNAPSEPDFDRVESVWDIEVPADADAQAYYSSEVDFHGGRDDVYVLRLPEASRSGIWDPSTYATGVPTDGSPTVADIVDSSSADVPDEVLSALCCAQPVRTNQNYLLTCHHADDDQFYVFEQIF